MAGVRKSYSKLTLQELLLQKEEIKRQKQAIKSEIKSRIPSSQSWRKKRKLSDHSLFAATTLSPSQPVIQAKLKQLLQFIVYGNQAEADKMLKESNPQMLSALLKQELEVVDYSGRRIRGTALRMAMGAKDVRYHADEERMVEMLEKYYLMLPDGKELMAAQIREQFPEGFEKQEQERRTRDSAALNKVFNAIANSKNNEKREKALKNFVDYLKLQTAYTITSGYHSNDELLFEALKLYDLNHQKFGGWNSDKNNFCWQKVIGNIERYVTACDAQAFCQGIYYIVHCKKKLARSLTFRFDPNLDFYPLDSAPHGWLGDNYATSADGMGALVASDVATRGQWLEDFARQKTAMLRTFIQHRGELSHSPRAVM